MTYETNFLSLQHGFCANIVFQGFDPLGTCSSLTPFLLLWYYFDIIPIARRSWILSLLISSLVSTIFSVSLANFMGFLDVFFMLFLLWNLTDLPIADALIRIQYRHFWLVCFAISLYATEVVAQSTAWIYFITALIPIIIITITSFFIHSSSLVQNLQLLSAFLVLILGGIGWALAEPHCNNGTFDPQFSKYVYGFFWGRSLVHIGGYSSAFLLIVFHY